MKYWRPLLLLVLILLPIIGLVVAGVWALWMTGWWWWVWWLLPICWGVGYLLARFWQRKLAVWPADGLEAAQHWTPQDQQALAVVESQQKAVTRIDPGRLTELQFYYQTASDLGVKIARHYHGRAQDPVSSLTVPEILAAAHLACEDLERWVRDYVPGSHMVTVGHWRTLAKTPKWLRAASNVSWAVALVAQPANVARFLASKLTVDSTTKQVQANVLAWFYISFVRHVGYYLIEMNSGRLRGGADRYRAMVQRLNRPDDAAAANGEPRTSESGSGELPSTDVTVAVVGQTNAGKSSLVNSLLGGHEAATDALPLTRDVRRFRLELCDPPACLTLLDTPGYGGRGPSRDQVQEARSAFEEADLVLLVINASDAARQPDLELLSGVAEWFQEQPRRRPPPVLGVVTHIDLLSPAMEWLPPYDWQHPTTAKEENIQAALEYSMEQLGHHLAGAVPVCADVQRDRDWGVRETLLPAMTALLGEARACALVRSLHAESNRGQFRTILRQLGNLGIELLRSPGDGK